MRNADSILFRRTSLALGTLGVRFRRVCIGGRSHCRKTKASVTMTNGRGEVTERLKVLASKASVRETVPWVRIPPSPPYLQVADFPAFESMVSISTFCARLAYNRLYIQMY